MTIEELEIRKAAKIFLDVVNCKSTTVIIPVDVFCEAIETITEAMRKEIKIDDARRWCVSKGYDEEDPVP